MAHRRYAVGDALLITWPRQGGVCERRGRDARVVRRQYRVSVFEGVVRGGERARRGSAEGVRGEGVGEGERRGCKVERRTRADE